MQVVNYYRMLSKTMVYVLVDPLICSPKLVANIVSKQIVRGGTYVMEPLTCPHINDIYDIIDITVKRWACTCGELSVKRN